MLRRCGSDILDFSDSSTGRRTDAQGYRFGLEVLLGREARFVLSDLEEGKTVTQGVISREDRSPVDTATRLVRLVLAKMYGPR